MFKLKLNPQISLLTVTRTGLWSIDTVVAYETALRNALFTLQSVGRPTSCIIDVRSTPAPHRDVAEALRCMVARLGPLQARHTAIVVLSGVEKLRAKQAPDPNARVFDTMLAARRWIRAKTDHARASVAVHDEPSNADAAGRAVHVHGPCTIDVMLTPTAALETAKRISNAAVEVLLAVATTTLTNEARSNLAAAA